MAANTGQHGTLVTKKSKAWIGKIYIAGKTYVAGNRPQWFGTHSAFASVIVSEAALPLIQGGCNATNHVSSSRSVPWPGNIATTHRFAGFRSPSGLAHH